MIEKTQPGPQQEYCLKISTTAALFVGTANCSLSCSVVWGGLSFGTLDPKTGKTVRPGSSVVATSGATDRNTPLFLPFFHPN
jgi:hypothetical protein